MSPVTPTARGHATSIASVSLGGSLIEKLEAATAAGFTGIELFEPDLLSFKGHYRELRRLVADLGVRIEILQPFRDFEGMPPEQRAKAFDRAERKFDIMTEIGTDLMLVCSNVNPDARGEPGRLAEDLAELASRAGRRGLRIGYEALCWGRHVRRWQDAWKIVQAANHPALGLIVDSFHTLALDGDCAGLRSLDPDRLFFVQIADAHAAQGDDLREWSRHTRAFPGQGVLDVAHFTREVLACGYSGPLSLEVFNDDFVVSPPKVIAHDGMASLELLRNQIAETAVYPSLMSAGGDVELLEFVVEPEQYQQSCKRLLQLGFTEQSGVTSMTAATFRRSKIEIVLINEEPVMTPPGGGVGLWSSQIGIRSTQLASRADAAPVRDHEAYLATSVLDAPGGLSVRVLDMAKRDGPGESFQSAVPAVGSDESSFRVDHLVLALPKEQMDTHALFWKTAFDLDAQEDVQLTDTSGSIRSRVLCTRDRSLTVVLNASNDRSAAPNKMLSRIGRPVAIQHVAFAVDDIFAAVESYRAAGGRMLEISDLYYHNLQDSYDLTPGLIANMRRNGIMFDANDQGSYLHAYTDTLLDSLFFELVERRGTYHGFGAVNGQARLFAQAADMISVPELL
jgi:4-hydroxyphenylpyruvate dioxygenase